MGYFVPFTTHLKAVLRTVQDGDLRRFSRFCAERDANDHWCLKLHLSTGETFNHRAQDAVHFAIDQTVIVGKIGIDLC